MDERRKSRKTTKDSQAVSVLVPNGLNIRKTPSLDAHVVRVAPKDDILNVTNTRGDWGFVGDGWIMLKYTDFSTLK